MQSAFRGDRAFLSNFYDSPVTVFGDTYPTAEHAYQAQKCLDPDYRFKVRYAETPAVAKKLGKTAKLRKNWEDIKLSVMEKIVRAKFTQNRDLALALLATEDDYLEETNWWGDTFWGVSNGEGKNHLGYILMKIRWRLRTDPHVLEDVYVERLRQDYKWGDQRTHSNYLWSTILTEEVGESARASLEKDPAHLRKELIQVAAVAIAWIESIDGGKQVEGR